MPGLDIPQLDTFEEEWRCGPDSQHQFSFDQSSKSQESGEMYLTHVLNPVFSERDHGFQCQRIHQKYENGPRSPLETGLMDFESPYAKPQVTQNDSNDSSTVFNESQKSAKVTDLGREFERILDIVEDAGFDSIEMMVAQYYTANLRPNSTSWLAQANGRSRGLRRLLQTLQKAAQDWSKQEKQAYEEEIVRSAKCICLHELSVFRDRQANRPRRPTISRTESAPESYTSSGGSLKGRSDGYNAGTVSQQRELLVNVNETSEKKSLQQERRLLRQCLPETWSLLIELAQVYSDELRPAQVSHVVYEFLHSLTTANAISNTM